MPAMISAPIPRGQAQSDLDLVQRHRYGDAAAFEEIYRRHGEMVYNLAYRLCSDPEQAEDLAQDAFLRVYRHLHRFRGKASLKTWIYRIGLNVCRSRLARRRWPSQPLAEENDGEGVELVDRGRSPEARASAGEAGRTVQQALEQLPEPFREAVVLCDLEGLSYQEIAEVLRVRIGTVRSRIARGRLRLRALLEKKAEEAAP